MRDLTRDGFGFDAVWTDDPVEFAVVAAELAEVGLEPRDVATGVVAPDGAGRWVNDVCALASRVVGQQPRLVDVDDQWGTATAELYQGLVSCDPTFEVVRVTYEEQHRPWLAVQPGLVCCHWWDMNHPHPGWGASSIADRAAWASARFDHVCSVEHERYVLDVEVTERARALDAVHEAWTDRYAVD